MSDQDTNEIPEEEVLDVVTTDETVEEQVEETASESEDDEGRLDIAVEVKEVGACERHVVVTVSASDIEKYKDEAYSDLMPKAQIPGFRIGRAPRKLVESRFKSDIVDQVKGSLIMDAMSQVTDEQEFSAISEPDFNFEAVQMPEDGDLTFEFNVEVRPEFELPEWKGLDLEKVIHEYSDEEVDERAAELLQRYGDVEEVEGAVEAGDTVNISITFQDGDKITSTVSEENVIVRGSLSFSDGSIDGFGDLVIGASAGDSKDTTAKLSDSLDDEDLAGKEYAAGITIHSIKRTTAPEMTPEFLEEVGGFETVDDMKAAVREELERQLNYHQQQRTRGQITELLTADASWELPPQLLRRQSQRELQRSILELQASGFPDEEIRRHINRLQQNLLGSTEKALKEHFILERIAEDHDLEATPEDIEREILIIALQQQSSPRAVRAQLEKRGDMDALRNQIIERQAIELITEEANFTETGLPEDEDSNSFALSAAISGIQPVSRPMDEEEVVAEVETEEVAETPEVEEVVAEVETEEVAETPEEETPDEEASEE
ncbi:trigger factor [Pirellulaceae bacterium]|jgi:trigger factor|nr:trigger factor [Pirellulaceae bacterium]